ncbi:hypothetical protein ACSBLW_11175 [Thioclava sp. FR2]|uniref:hypothetical protein n=1 Tax=Thioclava sp. FR2 TaxID=3445780 RepID=UPI003EBEFFEC
MKLTFDWNCIIEVEEGRAQAQYVIDLVDMHRQGHLEVALLAASASENSKSKRFPGNAELFTERLNGLGWQDLPLVPMPAVPSLSYYDFCFYLDENDNFEEDMGRLWEAIAPNVPREPTDRLPIGAILTDEVIQSEELSRWRNTWCDVVSAYSHIYAARDIFVTNNTRDFQSNWDKLSSLGMKHIATPKDTLAVIASIRSAKI